MSQHEPKTWLVAYDIADPKRLRRVHRMLRKTGLATQYSVFTVEASDVAIKDVLQTVSDLIDAAADDVRAYHLPERCAVWRLGVQHWPDGALLTPLHAARLLLNDAELQQVEASAELAD